MNEKTTVNGTDFSIIKLLGKGKGGIPTSRKVKTDISSS